MVQCAEFLNRGIAKARPESVMSGVEGYMYPNEVTLYWSVLIVLYPYITGLVAGAFILASLVRIFHVDAVKPTYRLALLTALAFLLVAPLPLQLHLGHPERSPEMYFTPHATSAMARFGFVYLWYLMAVLVFEIWLDYRRDIVLLSQSTTGWRRLLYRIMTLGSSNISPRALAIDERTGWIVTLIGIPSAFILHGYVGFIFGSIKANPWWNSPLMPVVFIFSAMVSGIAAVMLLYMALTKLHREPIDMPCVDTIAMYLFYIFILDFSLEMLDLIHRVTPASTFRRSSCRSSSAPSCPSCCSASPRSPSCPPSSAGASTLCRDCWSRSASSPCAGMSSSAASSSPRASSATPPTR
jgi:Ni/Fe-hydrogenase subunit HybB-like protein